MEDKLTQIENKYEELCARSEQPDFFADPKLAAKYLKEQRELEPVVTAFRRWKQARADMAEALALMGEEPEMKDFLQEEYQAAKQDAAELEDRLRVLLLPRDPNDDKNVIVEIRGGVGGEESALFAHSLFRMYSMYAAAKGWTLELLNYSETELGGVKEADFLINGEGAFSRMKFESGVHRVQRVPETESGGRIHTSTATVAVLPEMEAAEVDIRPEDVEMQVYRSSGAGGQHINKTSSAVRLIHKPTGIVTACQTQRSQFQNRDYAMEMLKAKLVQLKLQQHAEKISDLKGVQLKIEWGSQIRSYVFMPYQLVKDNRTDYETGNIQSVMDGELDGFINAYLTKAANGELKK